MRIRPFFFLLPLFGLWACAKDEPAPQVLKVSEHELHFSGKGGAWLLTVNSNAAWQVEGTTEWCTVDKQEGCNTDDFIVSVEENATATCRSAALRVACEQHEVEVNVQQDTFAGECHYVLPVVFHIIHSGEEDTVQCVASEVIAGLVRECNRYYRNEFNGFSVDMNLELLPAAEDPEGTALDEPGIHRVLRSNSARQDSEAFLGEDNTKDADLLWDPNRYVNVYVFAFIAPNELGRATLPCTPRENSLEGLQANNTYYTRLPEHPWGICLNNAYLHEENAPKTLAHELGHYLGLLHVFALSDCAAESDYCDDTPSYNRTEYESWLTANGTRLSFLQKCQRRGCDGQTFISYNMMDYDYSYQDRFTPDQFLRIRHVLEHSPLIPGPKDIIVTRGLRGENGKVGVRTLE